MRRLPPGETMADHWRAGILSGKTLATTNAFDRKRKNAQMEKRCKGKRTGTKKPRSSDEQG